MLSNLFFLITALILINFAPDSLSGGYNPFNAFIFSILGFSLCLTAIGLQNWVCKQFIRGCFQVFSTLAHIEILLFLGWNLYVIKGHRIFLQVPYFEGSKMIPSAICLLFYLAGLVFFHYTASISLRKRTEISRQLRMIIPFFIPFLLFTLFLDVTIHVPNPLQKVIANGDSWTVELFLFFFSIAFVGLSMIFLPFFIQKIWQCSPLSDADLLARLESLCKRAKFRHAGMMEWTVMNRSHTAAIIGIVPRFRYVMFTQTLLHYLSQEEVEAILAHEIGHSKHRHLLIYPFIIAGMMVSAGLFSLFFSQGIYEYLLLKDELFPSSFWQYTLPLSTVIPYIVIVLCYFRFIFGYFSRLFERQADLHIFDLNIAPVHLISALDQVAIATGGTHKQPSWHHYSIQERIDFLDHVAAHPELVKKHHKRVKRNLWIYFAILAIAILVLVSPMFPEI